MVWMIPIISAGSRRRRCYSRSGSGVIGVIILLIVGILFSVFFLDVFDFTFSAIPVFFIVAGIGFVLSIVVIIASANSAMRRNSERNRPYYSQTQRQQRVLNPYTQNSDNYQQQQIPTHQEYDSNRLNKQSAIYCSYCGDTTTLDALFCPKCGNRLNK